MPYCTQCGTEVQAEDTFCAGCGSTQGSARPRARRAKSDFLKDLSPRNASLFCYIPWVGWIAAIVVLASDRFREDKQVRFHAFQGIYLFVIWLMVDWVFGAMFGNVSTMRFLEKGLQLAVLGAWIVMLVKTSQGEHFHLPVLGELAERSVAEQR